ncbi:MAG: hypothetical protein RLZZ210_913 [Pseudomonadota bacterium]|jgi:hypothetical protein
MPTLSTTKNNSNYDGYIFTKILQGKKYDALKLKGENPNGKPYSEIRADILNIVSNLDKEPTVIYSKALQTAFMFNDMDLAQALIGKGGRFNINILMPSKEKQQ